MAKVDVPMVDICPECGHTGITERKTKTPDWRCNVCQARFDEPETRESKRHTRTPEEERDDTHREIEQALRGLERDGQQFVKSSHVADRVDELSSSDVGHILSEWGVESGNVELWRDNSPPALWRITVGAPDDGSEVKR